MGSWIGIVFVLTSFCAIGQGIQQTNSQPSVFDKGSFDLQREASANQSGVMNAYAIGLDLFDKGSSNLQKEDTYITIIIRPLIWRAWWVRLLLVTLLVSGLYGIYQYRILRLKLRQEQEFAISIRAQELERQRFAKELHDGIGANLAILRMYLTSLGSPAIPIEELKMRSMAILKTSLDDIRSIIHDMHPRSLAEAGLVQAVSELVAHIQNSGRLTVQFCAEDVPNRLPEHIEINLFRIIQELVQNALKHANANNVRLQLSQQNNVLTLTYQDNGCGFDQSLAHQRLGNGLLNMRQRISVLKGTCQIKSSEPNGTIVEIVIPLPC